MMTFDEACAKAEELVTIAGTQVTVPSHVFNTHSIPSVYDHTTVAQAELGLNRLRAFYAIFLCTRDDQQAYDAMTHVRNAAWREAARMAVSGHGGARAGAGRPASEQQTKPRNIRLTDAVWDQVKTRGGCRVGAQINT